MSYDFAQILYDIYTYMLYLRCRMTSLAMVLIDHGLL